MLDARTDVVGSRSAILVARRETVEELLAARVWG
jgi:hypothetical protein